MANRNFFEKIKKSCILINSARGAVVDSDALLWALQSKKVAHAIVDTWENEPDYRMDLLDRVDFGTPHIAGYSYEGKVFGTWMAHRHVCQFLRIQPAWEPTSHLHELREDNPKPQIKIFNPNLPIQNILENIVSQAYSIKRDDELLRQTISKDPRIKAANFNRLRKNYSIRREFSYFKIDRNHLPSVIYQKL